MTSSEPTTQSSIVPNSGADGAMNGEIAAPTANPNGDKAIADAKAKGSSGFWPVFLSTFVTIFLAELGDKTQVTTMLMSAESKAPLVVFLGAGLALISTSLIGVLLGQWLSKRISEKTLDICAGILLILISIGLVGDIFSH